MVRFLRYFKIQIAYRSDGGPPEKATMNEEEATSAQKTMNHIRRMENRAAELYRLRLINDFLHLYSGQVEFTINRFNRVSLQGR